MADYVDPEGYAAGMPLLPGKVEKPRFQRNLHTTTVDKPSEAINAFMAMIGRKLGEENDYHTTDTAMRFTAMMREMLTPVPFNFTTFPSTSDEMVTLGPIPFYTLCAHHMVPFFGNAYVGYVPNELIAGLSKVPRTIEYVTKDLWVQEELTAKIADYLLNKLQPAGVAVVLKAEHLCMAMRGVRTAGVITTTSTMRGVYADHDRTAKAEFMEWIRGL